MKTLLLITSLFLFTNFNIEIKTNNKINIDEYVDDIPFDTYKIYKKHTDTIIYQDEKYIDDIPFDTYEIYKKNK
jgi:hypothetical protein